MVAHRHGGGVVVAGHTHDDGRRGAGAPRTGVVDRVADQVAQDALHPAYVGLGQAGTVRCPDHESHAALVGQRAGAVHDAVGHVDEVDVVDLELRRARVEPADLEQVREQRLEPVQLGLQQLGGPRGHGVEVVLGVVQDVAGHPHGGQRGAQLVGDVGDEAALDPAELLELTDLALQVGGHLVEGGRQAGQVVLAGDLQALLQLPGRQPLRDPPRHPDRG